MYKSEAIIIKQNQKNISKAKKGFKNLKHKRVNFYMQGSDAWTDMKFFITEINILYVKIHSSRI